MILAIDDLNVFYGQSQILNNVTMQIKPQQVVCLLGRNGVGKTTLLRSIMGTLRPRAGQMRFDDKDITRTPTHQRARAGIGYVPQGRGIFPHLTVKENLLMGFEASHGRVSETIEEMYAMFPIIKKFAARAAGNLSGGQQQQLAIARALLSRPRLLLLDEPTEGIQPSIVSEIQEVIEQLRLRGDVAILLVEQFLDFALGAASYYYIMEKGQIVSEGETKAMDQASIQRYLAV